MRLKTSYTSREVTGLTGLTARQLQGWDQTRVFLSAIASRRTSAGGFTERRYTPVDVLELVALADLRRRGFPPAALKLMMDTLRDYFRRRLSETLDDAGDLRLLTDGNGLFLRTRQGHIFDLLVGSDAAAGHRRRTAAEAGHGRARRRPQRPRQRPNEPRRSDDSSRVRSVLAAVLFTIPVLACRRRRSRRSAGVPTPASVFGFEPGADNKLANYDQVVAYFQRWTRRAIASRS